MELAEDFDSLKMDDDLYSYSSDNLLSFQQFHQSIQTKPQSLSLIKMKDIIQEPFLAVSFNEVLKISIVQKIGDKLCEKEQVLRNPLGASIFTKINNILEKKNNDINPISTNSSIDDIFRSESKNSPDILVKDIYGDDSSSIGLPQKLLASCLGKLSKSEIQAFEAEEIKRSLLIALAINAGQLAGLISIKNKVPNVVIVSSRIEGLTFSRFFYVIFVLSKTILKFNSPQSKLYMKVTPQKHTE